MRTIGATLASVQPGAVEIVLPFRADLTQQHGFLPAGIVATMLPTIMAVPKRDGLRE